MDAFSTYCRVLRRYHQIELKHIINELHYIASGHLEHQIPFELKGQMQEVVNNINALVGATTNAMEEERAIKRSKDELITSVGHDLRTPLTSIIGYLGLLENKQYRNQEDILKYAHTAYLKSKEMKTLVDDLFEYAKMNKLESLLKITTIDLCEMLQQIGASFELEGQKQDVKIEVKAPDSPVGMEADGQKLARVFTNLVSNALKYGKGATKITLELREVSPTDVEIKVSNNGKKIPEEAIDNIFKRFYRAESSRSRETGGTGLGLAIAEGIVDLHSGTIVVDSNDDLTTFTIRLPKIHPKKAANTN